MIPPHWTNSEIVSTSDVTRETSDPRRSVPWESTDSACTCLNALTRSVASPASVLRKRRTLTSAEQVPATSRTTAAAATSTRTRRWSTPPSASIPVSTVCWTANGTTTRPAAARTAKTSVTTTPSRISGETCRPRRSVARTLASLVEAIEPCAVEPSGAELSGAEPSGAEPSGAAAVEGLPFGDLSRAVVIPRPVVVLPHAGRRGRGRGSRGRGRAARRGCRRRRPCLRRGGRPCRRARRSTSGTRP